MKTKINTVLFGLFATVLMSGCVLNEPDVYYQYKAGESNFEAAKIQCEEYANRTVVDRSTRTRTGEKCTVFGNTITCEDEYSTFNDWGYGQRLQTAWKSCLSEKGWAPCTDGGLHLPECQ